MAETGKEPPQQYGDYVRRKIAQWLEDKWDDATCPICEQNTWAVEVVGEIPLRGTSHPGQAYPIVPLTCRTCGYTALFNSIVIGLQDEREFNLAQVEEAKSEAAE